MLIWFYFIWNYSKIFVFEGLIRIVVECLWSKVFNMFNGDICVCGWWVYIWFNLYGMIGGFWKNKWCKVMVWMMYVVVDWIKLG